ncbi:MAG: hypothetical protein ACI8XO_004840 [Verrucomicrobiales bacterium]|jgi:hypothetical protein
MLRLLPFALLFISHALADVVTINPVADTTLFEANPNENWGAQTESVAGTLKTGEKSRVLMRFDIHAHVPNGSTITAARLKTTVTRQPSSSPPAIVNSNFQLIRVLVPWAEGNKSGGIPGGDQATAGETTWNERFFSDASETWSRAGGQFESDYAEDPSASQFVSGLSDYLFSFNSQGIREVQSMLENAGSNYGWVLLTQNENAAKSARRFASREHASDPPELEVTFTPPLPQAKFEITSVRYNGAGDLTVEFNSSPGRNYRLETTTELHSGNWIPAPDVIPASGNRTTATVSPPENENRLFVRVSVIN